MTGNGKIQLAAVGRFTAAAGGQCGIARCTSVQDDRAITDLRVYTYFCYFPGVELDGIGPPGWPGPSFKGYKWAPTRMDGTEFPADTPLMQDRCLFSESFIWTNHCTGGTVWQYDVGPNYWLADNPAVVTANLLFFDGHVEQPNYGDLHPVADSGGLLLTWRQPWMTD